MRVLIAVPGADGERLLVEAEQAENEVIRFDEESGPEVLAARIRRGVFDFVVVDARPNVTSMDVVDACDSRGVLLVALVDDRDADENARTCGITEIAHAWSDWASLVRLATAGEGLASAQTILQADALRREPARQSRNRVRLIDDNRAESIDTTRVAAVAPTSPMQHSPRETAITRRGIESRVITVWGPTGAPGRTTVALNLAACAAMRGERVVLIDADTYGGAVAIRCGVFDEAPGIARACRLAGADALTFEELTALTHEVVVRGGRLNIVTGILGAARWPEIGRERLEKVITRARENFDTVILDVGFSLETDEEVSSDMLAPRRNGATLTALRASTDIVAVSAADSVGLARFIRLWSDVCETNADAQLTVAVNRVMARKDGSSAADTIATTFSRFAGIRDVVLIPESTDLLARADARAEPAISLDPNARFSQAIGEIAHRVLGGDGVVQRRTIGESLRERVRGLRLLG